MLINNDGTRYSLESIEEIIGTRAQNDDFPYLSDILGSDWGYGLPPHNGVKEVYISQALDLAKRYYKYSWS